ncbi:pentatricopeptide repeat-containing protein At3g26540 isoform X2 [Henckelia pumila]|uniref:pentatricopeptide repeat-containing protein At3g26540 isoform X2 n=1 Tax=Henckelia pumila TaxID=405737 RepID=UPI003C6E90A9
MGSNAGSISQLVNSPAITSNSGNSNFRLSAKALSTDILNNLRLGRLPKAVSILFASDVQLPFSLYAHLFRICASNKAIIETRKVESHLIALNPNPPVFLLNRAIESYGKCGCLRDAKELFDEMPSRNGGSWNAIITACTRNGFAEDALGLFSRMIGEGVFASEITFASVLGSCGNALELWLSRQVHGLILKYGFVGNVILESSIVDVYGKCRVMSDARRMFDEIRHPNDVSWNVIVRRYLDTGYGTEAVNMFSKMVRVKASPMSFTVSNAILACLSYGGLREGAQIHAFAIKINMEEDEVVSSTLIGMYAKCGDLGSAIKIFNFPCSKNLISCTTMVSGYAANGKIAEARELFDQLTERSVISWNVMLAGYTRALMWDKALDFVIMMRRNTKEIDHVTLGLILNICAAIPDVELGKQIHGYVYRNGFYTDLFVGNALLGMYGKCGNLTRARIWFYEMSHLRDKVSWNALLTSYARHGLSEQAMMIFGKMLGEAKPSKFTFGTLLAACANIFALELASKDVILCNTMILGCLHNGLSEKVFELFETMEKEGMRPDDVTFRGILLACISAGRIELGRHYFELMSEKYCLTPQLEHYDAVIELYGQYGYMDELELFMNDMPFKPTALILTKVFDFSRKHKCASLGEWASSHLNELLNPLVPFRFESSDSG